MRFLPVLFAILMAFAAPAFAEGELYLKKHEQSESKQLFAKPEKHVTEEQEAKILANSYYENCLLEENPSLTESSKNLLCACTSAKMSEEMTAAQMKAMFDEGPEGEEARNHMLAFVYAPCMEYPVRDLITENCNNNPEVAAGSVAPKELCKCLGDSMGEFMAEKGPAVIEMALRSNPNNMDPLGNFFNSYSFQAQSRQHMARCMKQTQLNLQGR